MLGILGVQDHRSFEPHPRVDLFDESGRGSFGQAELSYVRKNSLVYRAVSIVFRDSVSGKLLLFHGTTPTCDCDATDRDCRCPCDDSSRSSQPRALVVRGAIVCGRDVPYAVFSAVDAFFPGMLDASEVTVECRRIGDVPFCEWAQGPARAPGSFARLQPEKLLEEHLSEGAGMDRALVTCVGVTIALSENDHSRIAGLVSFEELESSSVELTYHSVLELASLGIERRVFKSEGDVNIGSAAGTPATPRQKWQNDCLHQRGRELVAADEKVFVHQSLSTPCLTGILSSSGASFEDADGKRYLDFHGNSIHQVGYRHPRVVSAVKDVLDTLPFCPRRFTNTPAVELARRLCRQAPLRRTTSDLGADDNDPTRARVLFCPGGSQAIGIALKIVRATTGRYKTLSFSGSFHGASLEASAVGGQQLFKQGMGPLAPGSFLTPPFEPCSCHPQPCHRCALLQARAVGQILEENGDIGALICEPVRCTTVVVPPSIYWKEIRLMCDKTGTLLIFDEIPTCLGRTGYLFASERYAEVCAPDVIVIGKGLGGAMIPIAATIVRSSIAARIPPPLSLGHYTHEKSSVGAAAALATLDVVEDEQLSLRANELGELATRKLHKLQARHPVIYDVRSAGSLIAVELRHGDDPDSRAENLAEQVLYESLARGLNFKVSSGNILILAPALIISNQDMARAIHIIDEALTAATIITSKY